MRRSARPFAIPLLQSVGPFEREICTAVTLNSGQLVAQSEEISGDDIDLRGRMMKRRVDDPGATRIGDQLPGSSSHQSPARLQLSPNRLIDARCSHHMADISNGLFVPDDIRSGRVLGSTL